MDMRSVSLQVAHFMHDRDVQRAKRHRRGSYVRQLRLPYQSGTAHIYRHSYLGYGLLEARSRTLKTWPEASRPNDAHPCLVPGFHGFAANLTACMEMVQVLLGLNTSCGSAHSLAQGRCTFAGAWDAPWRGHRVVLLSYFFDRLLHAGVVPPNASEASATPGDFDAAAALACAAASGGAGSLSKAFPEATPGLAEWLCFDLAYLAVLLRRGFGLQDDEPLTVLRRIRYNDRDFEASWALGLAIQRMASA